jgi:hypothetical protein
MQGFWLPSLHAVGESGLAGIIDKRHLKRLGGDSNESKIGVSPIIQQNGRMQAWIRRRHAAKSRRQRPRHELVKIDAAVTVRVIGIGLHIVNVTGEKHDVLDLVAKNPIDNNLPFPFETGPV